MAGTRFDAFIQRGLAASPRARALCAELAGQSVAIDVRGFTRRVVRSDGRAINVLAADATQSPAALISGGPMSLLALAGPTPEAVLQRGDVQIEGDVEIAQRFRELFFLLRPDLEEELARLVGDIPARQVGRAAQALGRWGGNAARTAALHISEFLSHERRDLVPRNEGEAFFREVDAIREDVDRLEARVTALTTRNAGT